MTERNGFFNDELEISDGENDSYHDDGGRMQNYDDDYIPPNDDKTDENIYSENSPNPSQTNEDSPKLEDSEITEKPLQRPKTSRASGMRPESAKRDRTAFDMSRLSDSTLAEELKDLFKHISRYTPQDFDLEPELKPFIPDFMPSIGDIDAFIKIKRPDQKNDLLGLTVLDEPETHQSDPSVLDLHLRAITKSSSAGPRTVRKLDAAKIKKDPKALDTWLKNIQDLHSKKPPASVHYSRRMPDIEDLMQVWPEPIEEALKTITLPSPEIDLSLMEYSKVVALLLDIPVAVKNEKVESRGRKERSSSMIEALHVLFTLYSEFKNSAHFKAIDRGVDQLENVSSKF